nr:hypothetical protein [uncultured Faecalimonas sp.]
MRRVQDFLSGRKRGETAFSDWESEELLTVWPGDRSFRHICAQKQQEMRKENNDEKEQH